MKFYILFFFCLHNNLTRACASNESENKTKPPNERENDKLFHLIKISFYSLIRLHHQHKTQPTSTKNDDLKIFRFENACLYLN